MILLVWAAFEMSIPGHRLHRLHQGGFADAGPTGHRLPGAGEAALNPNQHLLQLPLPTDKERKGCVPGIPAEAILEIGGTPQVVGLSGVEMVGHGICRGVLSRVPMQQGACWGVCWSRQDLPLAET